jgi:hypothetical protein
MIPSSVRRRGKSRPNKANKSVASALISTMPRFPRNINGSMIYPIVVRFGVSNMTTGVTITRGNLLNMYLCGTTTTQVARNWESVKIRKIEIFSTTSATGSGYNGVLNSIQLEWLSSLGPSKVIESVGNFEHPAFISSKPPAKALSSFWSLSGNNETEVLMRLSGSPSLANSGTNSPLPVGTLIDLHLEVINLEDATPVLTTVSAAIVGQNYIRSFDGTALSVPATFTPASYLQI